MKLLIWLSRTPVAVWARESETVWGYPTVLFLHTFGLAILVGFTTAIDFRVLGFSRNLPLAPLQRFFRFIWTGFWINAISGAMLLVITPSKFVNPAFAVKMALIALGVVNLVLLKRQLTRDVEPMSTSSMGAKVLAATSLALWAGAITAGRLMAYVGGPR
jgi:hypothetical protein